MRNNKVLINLFLCIALLSCNKNIRNNLDYLSGYWQVKEVKEKGETFSLSNRSFLYDYYGFDQKKGFRKKLRPLLDGTFETSADLTTFEFDFTDKKVKLKFVTPWNEWIEEIIFLSQNTLVLQHQGRTYHYKRVSNINLTNE
ncbi:lipocalin family protein [Flavobacteriaceae bacterium]|nr:lipocalin family protein [Flavobacteriaceae bacterium]